MPAERLALFTTVYPGVERYLAPWYDSVQTQTDRDFDLWIGTDGLTPQAVTEAIAVAPAASWLPARNGDTPARLRTAALERLVSEYSGVVFVDSDDVLHASRVAAAREGLRQHDVTACALQIIDADGHDVGAVFGPDGADLEALLPRHNVFGLSNSAYRSTVLERCLPAPDECILMDWLLVTRAWAAGAKRLSAKASNSSMLRPTKSSSGTLANSGLTINNISDHCFERAFLPFRARKMRALALKMATVWFAMTYISYSWRSVGVNWPSLHFSANWAMRAWALSLALTFTNACATSRERARATGSSSSSNTAVPLSDMLKH